MRIKDIVTRTIRNAVLTIAAVGTFACLAVLPANAAAAAPHAPAAATTTRVDFTVLCQPGTQYFRMNIASSAVGVAYAYRLAAYDWTPAAGWQWLGPITGISYGTTVGLHAMTLGGVQSRAMPTGHYWVVYAQVWVRVGTEWSAPTWMLADHADADGRYGKGMCHT